MTMVASLTQAAIITDYAAIAARMRELRHGSPGENPPQATIITCERLAAVQVELHQLLAQCLAKPPAVSSARVRSLFESALVDIQLLRSAA